MGETHSNFDAVVDANRRFYDQIADVYDSVDRRRATAAPQVWLQDLVREILQKLRPTFGNSARMNFLDAGAGSGYLAKVAREFFPELTLADVSQKMLDRIDWPDVKKICADCCELPVLDESFHCVGAFATLHHLQDPRAFFKEAWRVLKPGGILYTDHDIEKGFVRRFRWPLKLYRFFFDHGRGYLKACPSAKADDYHMSEFHGDRGLSIQELTQNLEDVGFQIETSICHWDGMGPLSKFFGKHQKRGWAPVIRIVARKLP